MKRPANSLSDAVIKAARPIVIPAGTDLRLIGDWPMSGGEHALVIAVPATTVIEIGEES